MENSLWEICPEHPLVVTHFRELLHLKYELINCWLSYYSLKLFCFGTPCNILLLVLPFRLACHMLDGIKYHRISGMYCLTDSMQTLLSCKYVCYPH